MKYYFLLASLPALQYDVAPPIRMARLRELCAQHVDPAGQAVLARARLDVWNGEAGSHPALLRWYRWETSVRNALARVRAQALGRDVERSLRVVPSLPMENGGADVAECDGVARAAAAAPSPLAAQEVLDRARWALFEDLEVGHPFALEALIAYTLKLQLLERRALTAAEAGWQVFERVREAAVASIRSEEAFHG